jgi:hypothetical protein
MAAGPRRQAERRPAVSGGDTETPVGKEARSSGDACPGRWRPRRPSVWETREGRRPREGKGTGPMTSSWLARGLAEAPCEPPEGDLNRRTAPVAPGPPRLCGRSVRLLPRRRQAGIAVTEDGIRRVRVRGFAFVNGVPPASPTGADDAFFRKMKRYTRSVLTPLAPVPSRRA